MNAEAPWTTSSLEKVTSLIKDGSHGTHKDVDNGVPLLSAKDIRDETLTIPADCRRIPEIDYELIHKNYSLLRDDILLTIVGSIGRRCQLTGNEPRFTIQRSVAVVRPGRVESAYLFHYFAAESFQRQLEVLTNASAQGGVYLGSLAQCSITYPECRKEQSKIADILFIVDRAIEQTEALIAKQQRIKVGLMQDLLTRGIDEDGYLRSEQTHAFKDSPLGKIPAEWEVKTTGALTRSLVPGRDKPELDNGGIPWITIPDIDELYIEASKESLSLSPRAIKEANARLMPQGTVIMSCVGEFGLAAVARRAVVANQQLHGFVCDRAILPEWLAIQIINAGPRIDRMATQTTIKYLNKTGCESIEIAVPKMNEQERAFKLLRGWIESLQKQRKQISKLRSLKAALMQDLLTGNRRVTSLLKPDPSH
jgi:type I restriction enzyme S subunit